LDFFVKFKFFKILKFKKNCFKNWSATAKPAPREERLDKQMLYLLCMASTGVGAPLASQQWSWCAGDMAGRWVFSGMTSKAGMVVVAVAKRGCCWFR
jgi:hypothetical protein